MATFVEVIQFRFRYNSQRQLLLYDIKSLVEMQEIHRAKDTLSQIHLKHPDHSLTDPQDHSLKNHIPKFNTWSMTENSLKILNIEEGQWLTNCYEIG